MRRRQTSTLVFDFDGTIALGHGPVLAYATSVADALGPAGRTVLEEVTTTLHAHPSGRVPGSDSIDGYAFVRQIGLAAGASEQTLGDAYLRSRSLLATPDATISAPAGLAGFLDEAAHHAHLVLATNAPDIRITEALSELGAAERFDEVHTSVGKPQGLTTILDRLLPRGPLLSIGDVWINDLAPAQARGASTALVGDDDELTTSGGGGVKPDFRAARLDALYQPILHWLRNAPPS